MVRLQASETFWHQRSSRKWHYTGEPRLSLESAALRLSGRSVAIDLSEWQWKRVEPLLPKPRVRKDWRGRPWRDPRDVLNGVLWVIQTGAP